MKAVFAVRTAAFLGFLGVLLGALSTHKLKGILITNGTEHTWTTAMQYLWWHALALLAVAKSGAFTRWVAIFWSAGIFLFCGSLFVFALTLTGWMIWVTPFGGVSLMVGWLCLAYGASRA
jgi:uncharacterized membrane protein YgdD (TMEM256/DUF423 family)